ncbi:hypothetical protein M501DRAFT_269162 [Patellaria atrata CBS 101060]|uniref:F-box domain-containing protein n=1 Tax=Patellaria atrata CBS 101060 TaxID=1346257 RepID=A0A9P4S5D6_9PEZI|nr:hypothetical protein M501DRAFT_269162 [Patellaria atrata CBS 101060]
MSSRKQSHHHTIMALSIEIAARIAALSRSISPPTNNTTNDDTLRPDPAHPMDDGRDHLTGHLPIELLDEIFQYLPLKDAKHARLACKALYFASLYLSPSFKLDVGATFNERDIRALQGLVTRGTSQHVKQIRVERIELGGFGPHLRQLDEYAQRKGRQRLARMISERSALGFDAVTASQMTAALVGLFRAAPQLEEIYFNTPWSKNVRRYGDDWEDSGCPALVTVAARGVETEAALLADKYGLPPWKEAPDNEQSLFAVLLALEESGMRPKALKVRWSIEEQRVYRNKKVWMSLWDSVPRLVDQLRLRIPTVGRWFDKVIENDYGIEIWWRQIVSESESEPKFEVEAWASEENAAFRMKGFDDWHTISLLYFPSGLQEMKLTGLQGSMREFWKMINKYEKVLKKLRLEKCVLTRTNQNWHGHIAHPLGVNYKHIGVTMVECRVMTDWERAQAHFLY